MGYLGIDFELLYSLNWNSLLNLIKGKEQRISDGIKGDWERMRVLASILIAPHTKKGKKITPKQLVPLPWDKKKEEKINEKANERVVDNLANMLGGM